MGSAWLLGGENLGLSSGHGPNHPLADRVSVPRMVVAQFDSIRYVRLYSKLAPEALRSLEIFLSSSNKDAWFTVFLSTFLLLHLVAGASQDRYRYAQQNFQDTPPVCFDSSLLGCVSPYLL